MCRTIAPLALWSSVNASCNKNCFFLQVQDWGRKTHRWEHWIVTEIRFIGQIVGDGVPAGPVLSPAIIDSYHELGLLPVLHWYTGVRLWRDVLCTDLTHLWIRRTFFSWQKIDEVKNRSKKFSQWSCLNLNLHTDRKKFLFWSQKSK